MRHIYPLIRPLTIFVAAMLLAAPLLSLQTGVALAGTPTTHCTAPLSVHTFPVIGHGICVAPSGSGGGTTTTTTGGTDGDGGTEPEPLGWPYVEDKSDTNYDPNIDTRVNANEAEEYAIYCYGPPFNYIVVVRTMPAPPTSVAGFPIAVAVNASDFSDATNLTAYSPIGHKLEVERDGDEIDLSGEGNRTKTFSLKECLEKAGIANEAQVTEVPCDPIALAAAEKRLAELNANLDVADAAVEISLGEVARILASIADQLAPFQQEVDIWEEALPVSIFGPLGSSGVERLLASAEAQLEEARERFGGEELKFAEAAFAIDQANLSRLEELQSSAQTAVDTLRAACANGE